MADKVALSEAENKTLALAWQCFKAGPPDINWEKLSKLAGHTNMGSTRNSFAKIKIKLQKIAGPIDDEDAGTAPASRSHTPSATRPKRAAANKRKAAEADDEDHDHDGTDGEGAGVTGKGKEKGNAKRGRVAKKAKEEEEVDADATESDGTIPVKKTAPKKTVNRKNVAKKLAEKGPMFPNLAKKGGRGTTPRGASTAASEADVDAELGTIKEEEGEAGVAV